MITSNILQIISRTELLKQAPKHITEKLTDEIQLMNQKLGISIPKGSNYKKPADFTYLEYFNNLLIQEPGIIINSQAQPFTIKEDLYILVYAQKNPIIKKALQPMAKNIGSEVYKKNSSKLVKRNVGKLLQRYYELEPINEQKNIKKIVKWLQEDISNSQSFVKQVNENETVKTPQKKITHVTPDAPKKSLSKLKKKKISPFSLSQQQKKIKVQLKSEDFEKPKTAENINQVIQETIPKEPKEQKKVEVKKELQIKEVKKKRIVHKVNREHMNYPPSKQVAIKVSQQNVELNKILVDIEAKTKIKQLQILKYLDQLSGDLSLLNKYLIENDKTMLWSKKQDKLLEDKIFMDKADENGSVYTKKQIEVLTSKYLNLVKIKGKQAIGRRIAYLSLN